MSYDLDFWKYREGVSLNDQNVYQSLSDGEFVEGLEALPIAAILVALKSAFSVGWTQSDDQTWNGGHRGIFRVFTTAQFFRVDCYGMKDEDMNRLIEIGNQFGCPLYDPQVGERYGL